MAGDFYDYQMRVMIIDDKYGNDTFVISPDVASILDVYWKSLNPSNHDIRINSFLGKRLMVKMDCPPRTIYYVNSKNCSIPFLRGAFDDGQ